MIVGTNQKAITFDQRRPPKKKNPTPPPPPKKREKKFYNFYYVSNEEQKLVANIPTVILFSFRFGITLLYTVVFGRFSRPKKFNF